MELIVVMLIFGIVMTLISVSFNRIVASSGQIVKSTETDIGGLIGLELMRIDVGFAGFGLPWSLGHLKNYSEAKSRPEKGDIDPANFNDSPSQPPRAFVTRNDKGVNGSDYLVLKGTALGMTRMSRGWSYLNYSSTGAVIKQSKSDVELVPGKLDRIIVINSRVRGAVPVRELVTEGSEGGRFSVSLDDRLPEAFEPKSNQDSYLIYGISPAPEDSEDIVTFPFNRADYYIGPSAKPANLSPSCAPGTRFLYRGKISQQGILTPFPVLDCVADLQVIFMLSTSNDGVLVPHNDVSVYEPEDLRTLVKEVRLYILAQQGKKDPGYRYPANEIAVGDRTWKQSELAATFGSGWRQYRWKVYTIAVQPKNLE